MKRADLLIYDEFTMQHCHCQEIVDFNLRDMHGNDGLFEGITVIFESDFQQILPVIFKGSISEVVGACIQKSYRISKFCILIAFWKTFP
jgi:ATP-dependent DNA helicase PIF1